MGLGYKVQPSVGKMKKKSTMPAGSPKTGAELLKQPSGIPSTPAVRPTWQRNKSAIKNKTGSLY